MTAITVKAIPEDLVQFILEMQLRMRVQKITKTYSQSQTVIHIIKEYKKHIERDTGNTNSII